ncbi:hypothetical protein RHMOL_Rhmol09G0230100 [Rhododendron molle]|uniref:Uncharacterized protein n=1 Tax=Rhododendron molle TaxID=49168 RepID=A0ACC0MHG1_RHOML|nr:hypothetical protein RHMOL_Rhmol09G0230100 [Rhododendron molle]
MGDQETELPPHVLIFPYPAQSHVNSMLKLAELLCHAGIHVTFLLTDDIHRRLLRPSNAQSQLTHYPGTFRFETISDGLPDDDPRDKTMELFRSFRATAKPLLRELLGSDREKDSDSGRKRVSCIIADGIMSFAIDVAEEMGIPIIVFRTTAAFIIEMMIRDLMDVRREEFQDSSNQMAKLAKKAIAEAFKDLFLGYKEYTTFSPLYPPTAMGDQETDLPPHVLIFPYPAQGHVNSMLKLAELLCHAGIHVTFLLTDDIHRRLLHHSNAPSQLTRYPGFRFETISDGLPEDNPRDKIIMEQLRSFRATAKSFLRELLRSDREKDSNSGRKRVSCIIADGIMGFAIDVAEEIGIPVIVFRTTAACNFWAYFCGPKLIEAGEIPFQGSLQSTPVSYPFPSITASELLNHFNLQCIKRSDFGIRKVLEAMDDQETELLPPRVLIFPYPAQGHVNPMLKLAELLCHAGLHVTFLVTHFTHRRLLRNSTALISRLTLYSGFRFEAIPDGLPEDDPRSGDRVMELFHSFRATAKPLLRELLGSDGGKDSGSGRKRASCIIADGLLSFAIDVGEEVGIPVIIFRTTSACSFWAFFCGPKLIEAGEIPFQGNHSMKF